MPAMTRDQVIETLKSNLNKPVTIHFTDGIAVRVSVLTVDAEGFIHDLDSKDDSVFWVPFEEVSDIVVP
jgi:hypothetical protein